MSKGGFSRGAALNIRWGARFNPPKGRSTKIRLIPGKYKGFDGIEYDFFQYVQFFSARTRKSFVSSGKWEMVDGNATKVSGDCLGYDEWQAEIEEGVKKQDRSVSMRIMHAYTLLHLEWYHEAPVYDDRGKPKKYERGAKQGQVIMERVLCDGKKCEYCRDNVKKVFGKRMHWSMGAGHLITLAGIIKEINKDCVNCDGDGTIENISYDCSKCGKIAIDLDKYDLREKEDREEVDHIVSTPYACKCGNTDYLVGQQECSGCQDPTPLSIFDSDIEISSVGEDTQSTILVPRWTHTELSKELQEMAKPFDFPQIFAGDPLDQQAKMLRVSNPYGSGGGRRNTEDADKHSGSYEEAEAAPQESGRRGRRSSRTVSERDNANFED